MTYELHPLCTLFPRLTGAEFDALSNDIKANGLSQPIVLHDGMILDGGNRYRACLDAGVEPTFIEFDGANLVSFVLSANLHRRHMTGGQHAAIVSSAQDWGTAHGRGGDRRSDQSQAVDFDLGTVEQRAATAGVSRVTQMKADKVTKADPELAKQVAHGEISLPKAVEKVSPPKKAKKPTAPKKAKGKKVDQPKQLTAKEIQQAEAYDDGTTLEQLADEQQREIESLRAQIAAMEADDQKAETLKWRKCYDHAVRQQSEAMDNAKRCQDREKWSKRQLMRCGKAVGEDDPDKIAPAVEAMARSGAPKFRQVA